MGTFFAQCVLMGIFLLPAIVLLALARPRGVSIDLGTVEIPPARRVVPLLTAGAILVAMAHAAALVWGAP